MKTSLAAVLAVLALPVASACAATLIFDDLPGSGQVGEQYAHLGVHFSLTDFGLPEGIANGDSGNWGLNGTHGPVFEGFNGATPSSFAMTLTFDSPIRFFSLDASRANGSNPSDIFTVSGFLGTVQINTTTLRLGPVNNWTTISLLGTFDRVEWRSNGADGRNAYGVDYVNFTVVPEPALSLWFISFGVLFARCRSKRYPNGG